MKKLPFTYECPHCFSVVEVLSNTYPPICNNPAQHSTKAIEMVLQDYDSQTFTKSN